MLRDRKLGAHSRFCHDEVTSHLPHDLPTGFAKGAEWLSGKTGYFEFCAGNGRPAATTSTTPREDTPRCPFPTLILEIVTRPSVRLPGSWRFMLGLYAMSYFPSRLRVIATEQNRHDKIILENARIARGSHEVS